MQTLLFILDTVAELCKQITRWSLTQHFPRLSRVISSPVKSPRNFSVGHNSCGLKGRYLDNPIMWGRCFEITILIRILGGWESDVTFWTLLWLFVERNASIGFRYLKCERLVLFICLVFLGPFLDWCVVKTWVKFHAKFNNRKARRCQKVTEFLNCYEC